MRIKHILVLINIFVLVACSKNQDNDYISFYTNVFTKGAIYNNNNLKTNGFKCYGYYTRENMWAGTNELSNFMDGIEVNWNGSSYEYSPLKYWPNEGGNDYISFLAISPISVGTVTSSNGYPHLDCTIADNPEQQIDILASKSANLAKTANNRAINLSFKHILSSIGFSVVLDNTNSDNTATITSFKISYANSKVKNNGKFDYWTNGNWVLGDTFHSASTHSLIKSNFVADKTKKILNDKDLNLFILPQTLSEGDMNIEMQYYFTDPTKIETVSNNIPANNYIIGEKYTYNLIIKGRNITISNATITPWIPNTGDIDAI